MNKRRQMGFAQACRVMVMELERFMGQIHGLDLDSFFFHLPNTYPFFFSIVPFFLSLKHILSSQKQSGTQT
jgi:hypothetical protein